MIPLLSVLSSSDEEFADSMNRGARGSMPVTMTLFNRQGIKCTNFLDTVTKFYAILRGLISQGGNALFKITFYLFALLGWEAEECPAALVEVRRNSCF